MKNTLYLLYGVFSYVAFLASFLYLIGFVGDFGVPKSVNTGSSSNIILAMLLNTVLILLFALQHLVMARQKFKTWWTRIIPAPIERSTFVLAASASLALLFLLWQPIPIIVWEVKDQIPRVFLFAASLAGWAMVVVSSFLIDHFDLFGLRQVYLNFSGKETRPVPFRVHSLYRISRHPMMLGFLIALWFTPVMTVGHLLLTAEFTIFIFVGLFFEERDLIRYFGRTYRAYQQETPMLLPMLKKRKPCEQSTDHAGSIFRERCRKEPADTML